MTLSEFLKRDNIAWTFSKILVFGQSNVPKPMISPPISQAQTIIIGATRYMIQFILQNLYPKRIVQANYWFLQNRYQISRALPNSEEYIQMIENTRRQLMQTNLLDKSQTVQRMLTSTAYATWTIAVMQRAMQNSRTSDWLVPATPNDVEDIINIAQHINYGKFKRYRKIYINPSFAAVNLLTEPDANSEVDLILDDTLVSIRTTSSSVILKEYFYYLWAYFTILYILKHNILESYPTDIQPIDLDLLPNINNLAVWWTRYDYMLVIPVNILLFNVQNSKLFNSFDAFVDWFVVQLLAARGT